MTTTKFGIYGMMMMAATALSMGVGGCSKTPDAPPAADAPLGMGAEFSGGAMGAAGVLGLAGSMGRQPGTGGFFFNESLTKKKVRRRSGRRGNGRKRVRRVTRRETTIAMFPGGGDLQGALMGDLALFGQGSGQAMERGKETAPVEG